MSRTELPRVARYRPTIVWGTGTAVGATPYDDVSRYYLNDPGLVVDGIGRDQVRAYAPPAAPAFDLTLTNWGGEFSPGGPIGQLVGRGPKTYLDILWGDDPLANAADVMADDRFVLANGIESARLFSGEVNTAQHVLTRPQRSVQVRALGRFSILLDQRPQTTQLYESTPEAPFRTDQAISVLLDLVGWDPAMRVLDEGDTSLSYWWLDGSQDGLTALNQLLAAEGAGGCAYEQAGVFHFEGRQFRFNNPRSTDEQWLVGGGFLANPGADAPEVPCNDAGTFANGLTEVVILYDANPSEYTSNPDEVISSASLIVNQRTEEPVQTGGPPAEVATIWELGGPLEVPAGPDGIVVEGQLSDPYKSALVPVNAADVAPTAVSDFTVSSGTLTSVTLLETSGIRVRIKWVSTGGCTIIGTTSNGPQLRAVSLPVVSQRVVRSTIDTSDSSARYQPREHQMDAWPEIDPNVALDIVNSMALRYQAERRQATLSIVNINGAHMNAIMHARVSDRLRWFQQHGAINEPYWIERISHEIAPGGGLHVMTLGCERVFDQVGSRFDIGLFNNADAPSPIWAVFGE
jgi:hypothetical protein